MKYVKFVLAVIIMVVVVILVVQNHAAMSTEVSFRIDLLGLRYQSTALTIYHIVVIVFLFGVLITALFGMMERFRLKKEIRMLRNASKEKDQELNSLRNLPITSEEVAPSYETNE